MLTLCRMLLRDMPGTSRRLGFAIFLAAAASASAVALMGCSAWLIARAAEMPPLMYLNVAIVGVRTFGIARGVLRYVERLVSHDVALRLQSGLRQRVYKHLSSTTLLGRRSGDLLARVVLDVEAIMDLVVRVLLPAASASLVVGGTVAVLWRFSPLNAVLLLGMAVIAGVVAPWLASQLSHASDAQTAPLRGKLAQQTHEFNRCARDLVALGVDGDYLARLRDTDEALRRAEARAAWTNGLAAAVQLLATGAAVAIAIWCGAAEAAAGSIPTRMIAVLALVPLALHEVYGDVTKAWQGRTRVAAALRRVREVLESPPVGRGDVDVSPSVGEGRISARDLAIGWPGGPVVAENITFDVGPGQRLAITAPSGGGKTTLAATLLGLIPAVKGDFQVQGRAGYLAQDAHLFATTVAENLRIGNKNATESEISDALAMVQLGEWDPARDVSEFGTSISGGEGRRLAIARLTLGDMDVYLLDEPTEHLDEATASALMSDFWAVMGEAPVIIFTHDDRLISQCSQEIKLALCGTPPSSPQKALQRGQ